MKVSEIKKALKGKTIEVRASRSLSGYLSVWAIIDLGHEYYRINAQSHDMLLPEHNNGLRDTARTHTSLWFPGFCGTYAVGMEATIKLFETQKHENACKLMKIIRDEIEKKNLRYVYPDCDLSQVMEALESLGAYVKLVSIDGSEDTYQWKKDRRVVVEASKQVVNA